MDGRWTPPWPTWPDGEPVKVGETAMSMCGPLRIDGIELTMGGWRLWSNQSMYQGSDKWLYIIDEGEVGTDFPTRPGEDGEWTGFIESPMPDIVFAPLRLADMEPTDGEAVL